MKKSQIYGYYVFGYNYRWLRYDMSGCSKTECLGAVTDFLTFLDELSLQVTRQAATKLKKVRKDIELLDSTAKCDATLAKKIGDAIDEIDVTLDAELKLRHAYVVTPKRHHLDSLLDTPSNLLGSETFQNLPSVCQADFKDACRCIAFELPTSAAFHLMRVAEGVLRHYYCLLVKRGRVKQLLWKPMLEHLVKRKEGIPKPIIDHLDHIRENFRNPTQHPEARFDMDEAQDMLAIVVDVSNRIVRDLRTRQIIA